eukprot:maker-scaffold_41-snap-gene-2.33-mRNA-1 protein AED:0.00 eAED:0.00 QI:223/1/1/1/1/1/2/263/635
MSESLPFTRTLAQVVVAAALHRVIGTKRKKDFLAILLFVNTLSNRSFIRNFIAPFVVKVNENAVSRISSLLLLLNPVRKEYSKMLQADLDSTKVSVKANWSGFGKVITEIPKEGWSEEKIREKIDGLSAKTEKAVIGEMYSGSIYSYSYMYPEPSVVKEKEQDSDSKDTEEFLELTRSLSRVYTHAFQRSYLWNSLHEGEFGVGYWLSYQVIRMVASQYGAKADEVMGFITTGGTDSLMSALRLYSIWGKENKNLDIGEGVVLACENVHAAVDKGCLAYGLKLIKIPPNERGTMDIKRLKKYAQYWKNDLVAIVASTPSYTLGLVDDVKSVAAIAEEVGVGCHVDSCLGGFVITYLDNQVDTDFLRIPGVTSLSCDTHKNGWAPKGSSVLVTKNIPDKVHAPQVNLAFYGSYAIPGWDGGVYGTPANPGSQHVSHVLQAYVAMLRIGQNGYSRIAKKINETVKQCTQVLKKDPRLTVLDGSLISDDGKNERPLVNVFSFKIKSELGWGNGATYALAHEMAKRKFVVSALKGDRVHYCVTGRSAGNPKFLELFQSVLNDSLAATEKLAEQVKLGKMQFSGDAGLYGTLDAALSPSKEKSGSYGKYISNLLLGKRVADDLVKTHFYALQDPFCENTV